MSPKELDQLEINALALRNIAQTVLVQVGQLKKAVSTPNTNANKISREAEVLSRVMTGRRKPAMLRKTK